MIKSHKSVNYILTAALILTMSILSGCGETDPAAESEQAADEAITQAISELTPPPTSTNDDPNRRVMTINRADTPPYDTTPVGTVSITDPSELDIATNNLPPADDLPELEEGKYSGNGTPLVFDVSDCCVVAFGEFDKTMSDAILAAVNVYRDNGGLEPLEKNQSLGFCADCRAKEASYSFTHTRTNGTYWFTVAPAYYKAELMATDFATAQETVDAWMQTATGRQYLLGDEYMSIGISTFRTSDRNYIVCALGD